MVIVKASALEVGDEFATLHTDGAGTRRAMRKNGDGEGIPVEIWYGTGREVKVNLHPDIRVQLLAHAKGVA